MALQPRRRDRWLALLLLIAAVSVGYLLLVHPWWTRPLQAVDAEIAVLQARQLRIDAQLHQAPQIAQRLQQAQQVLASRPGFLPQSSPELASSALVQQLQEAVLAASPDNRSCAISNRAPLPVGSPQRFTRVAVLVRLRCGTPELAMLLHTLESGSPRLFVDNLSMVAQPFASAQGETGTGLDVSFELSGYLRPVDDAVVATTEAADAH